MSHTVNSEDSAAQASRQRTRSIYRVTLVGGVANFLLMLFKFFAGVAGGSAAMIADAVHSLSDFLTDIVVVVFVRIAGKPCDKDHGYGHGKYETLATAFIGLLLLFVGAGIFWNGARAVAGYLGGEVLPRPGGVALVAAVLSVVVKEAVYRYTVIRGRRLGSPAVVANAWHHRSDALSSLGTALGIGGAVALGEGWRVLDPLAAIVVSFFIVKVSVSLFAPSIGELLEKSLPEEDEQYILDVIHDQPGVSDPHHLRTRRIGNYCAIEVHIRMNKDVTIGDAHRVTLDIERRLRDKFGPATLINTHVEPEKPRPAAAQ